MAYIFDGFYCGYRTYTHVEEPDQLAVLQSRNSGQQNQGSYRTPVSLAAYGPWWWCHRHCYCHCCQGYCNRISVDNGYAHAAAARIQFRRPHQCVHTHIEQLQSRHPLTECYSLLSRLSSKETFPFCQTGHIVLDVYKVLAQHSPHPQAIAIIRIWRLAMKGKFSYEQLAPDFLESITRWRGGGQCL